MKQIEIFFYYLHWYNNINESISTNKMQFYFQVNGKCQNKRQSEIFNGKKTIHNDNDGKKIMY